MTETSGSHEVDDSDSWEVTRGCYEDGAFAKKIQATPDLRYQFSQIDIQVKPDPSPGLRQGHDHDQIIVKKSSGWHSFFALLLWFSLLTALLSGAIFAFILWTE